MARIALDEVSLTFRVRSDKRPTLKDYLIGRVFSGRSAPAFEVNALRRVSLRVGQGERVGVVGHNGAGKSTLLKLLAGIYPPSSGTREVEGRVCSLFDISLGFEGEASGWDNIAFRSYLHGLSPADVRRTRGSIAEFSELGEFLDMPVRYYSAGMLIRLAFAIATAADPEVLLVDEVLSVGDLAFQGKARERMRQMMSRAHLMVVVSHDLDALPRLCSRALWLDHGRIALDGPADQVVAAYRDAVALAARAA